MEDAVKERVYADNTNIHDLYAPAHDRAVPYIHRKRTRRYYWDLLQSQVSAQRLTIEGSHVLELGCGTGTFTDLILARKCVAYLGLDISPGMIDTAKSKTLDPACDYVCSNLEDFARKRESRFDIVFSFSFLHHLPDIEEALVQIGNLLKPGGVYIALHEEVFPRTPSAFEKLDERLQIMAGFNGFAPASLLARWMCCLPGKIGARWRQKTLPNQEGHSEYVDFQMAEAFDLKNFEGGARRVSTYSYFAFPELLCLSSPQNFQMLCMTKAE